MARSNYPNKVVIVIDTTCGISARNTMSGIFDSLNEGHRWLIQIINPQQEFKPKMVRDACDWGCVGMIVTDRGSEGAEDALLDTKLPLVFIDVDNPRAKQRPNTTLLFNDNDSVIHMAMDYLVKLGARRKFAFVPSVDSSRWSDLREKAFCREAAERGLSQEVFKNGDPDSPSRDHDNLCAWIRSLPRQTAILAAWDYRALQVINACSEAGIDVPNDLTVVGIDNDEIFCHSTHPALTSVSQDMYGSGYRAAEELDLLLRRKKDKPTKVLTVPAKGIVERESTHFIPPGNVLMNRALDYIKEHCDRNIHVDEIVKHVGTSRRLLEKRFRALTGESIREAVAKFKLEKIKKLVCGTRRQFSKIADECGFKSLSDFSHFYRKATGESPRSARKRTLSSPRAGIK